MKTLGEKVTRLPWAVDRTREARAWRAVRGMSAQLRTPPAVEAPARSHRRQPTMAATMAPTGAQAWSRGRRASATPYRRSPSGRPGPVRPGSPAERRPAYEGRAVSPTASWSTSQTIRSAVTRAGREVGPGHDAGEGVALGRPGDGEHGQPGPGEGRVGEGDPVVGVGGRWGPGWPPPGRRGRRCRGRPIRGTARRCGRRVPVPGGRRRRPGSGAMTAW